MYAIKLSDGTTIKNLTYDCGTFISQEFLDEEEIKNKLDTVTIIDDDSQSTFRKAELGYFKKNEEGSEFILSLRAPYEIKEELLSTIDLSQLSYDLAVEYSFIFDDWDKNGMTYTKDVSKVQYNGLLYKCITSHRSQPDWTPDASPSLWVRIDDPAEEWPEWRQPTGSTDAYSKGNKVSHNGKHWISNVDGTNTNTWEPGVFGWDEQPSDE